jgi:hypothetical protein
LEKYYNAVGEVLQRRWRSITTPLEFYFSLFWENETAFGFTETKS